MCSNCPIGTYSLNSSFSSSCSSCPSGYFTTSTGSSKCTACGSNSNYFPTKPLPSNYHSVSYNGISSTCSCAPGFMGSNCEVKDCAHLLPLGSSVSILFNAITGFDTLSSLLSSSPLNQDYINDGKRYLSSFLTNQVDINGDNIIEKSEVLNALFFRSVTANGLQNMTVWNCGHYVDGCNANMINRTRLYNEALHCFLHSSKHKFDCSGVSMISSLNSSFPNSNNLSICESYDQSWRPVTYTHPLTKWTYTPSAVSQIGANGKVCVYSNGINIQGYPFNTDSIARGIVSNFTDPNSNPNVTSYRRVYCIAVLLNYGNYSYECSVGLFYVSIYVIVQVSIYHVYFKISI